MPALLTVTFPLRQQKVIYDICPCVPAEKQWGNSGVN